MSSINPHFTMHYSQPEDYHFSHDSVFLARHVFELTRDKDISQFEILDLCSGCGIIGLDYLHHCQNELGILPKNCDFVEVQSIYEAHFQKNKEAFHPDTCHFININYDELTQSTHNKKYDLILCNPPYFHIGQGALSPSQFKNRCRFYIDSDMKSLFQAIANSLKPQGRAYVLARDLKDHKNSELSKTEIYFSKNMKLTKGGTIRGNLLIECVLI